MCAVPINKKEAMNLKGSREENMEVWKSLEGEKENVIITIPS